MGATFVLVQFSDFSLKENGIVRYGVMQLFSLTLMAKYLKIKANWRL
jgi:hypothetical protein